jgi:hypothetical protein
VRLARVEHDQEQLELSWEETYGKVRRALAALAKRQERESGGTEPDSVEPTHTELGAPGPSDYAKLRQIYPRGH